MLLSTFALFACNLGDDDAWGGGGSTAAFEDDLPEEIDTAEEEDDGWPDPVDADGPSVMDEECWLEEFGGFGWVISCEAAVKDEQDDTVGGSLKIVISGGAFGAGYSGAFSVKDPDASGDACEACLADDELLYFSLQDADDDEDYTLWFQLVDKQGNRGNELSVEIVGQ